MTSKMYKIAVDPNKMRGEPFHTISSKLVWFCLLRDVNEEGFVRTSALGISKEIGLSEKTVRNNLKQLCEHELIEYVTPNESPIFNPRKVRYTGCVVRFKDITIYTDNKKSKIRKKSDIQSDISANPQPIITTKTSSNDLSFVDPAFVDAFTTWLDHKKKQFKFEYKSDRSLKAAYAELVKLSGNNPEIAMQIVEQSMSKGWKGLFELQENGKCKFTTTAQRPTANHQTDRYSALEAAAGAVIRRNTSIYPEGDD